MFCFSVQQFQHFFSSCLLLNIAQPFVENNYEGAAQFKPPGREQKKNENFPPERGRKQRRSNVTYKMN